MLKKFFLGLLKSIFGLVFLLFTLFFSLYQVFKDETFYTQKAVGYSYDFFVKELPNGLLETAKTLPNANQNASEDDARKYLEENLKQDDLKTFFESMIGEVKALKIDQNAQLHIPLAKIMKDWKFLVEKFAVIMYEIAYNGQVPTDSQKRELSNNLYEQVTKDSLPGEVVVNFYKQTNNENFVTVLDNALRNIFWIAIAVMLSIVTAIALILRDDWRQMIAVESKMFFSSSLSLIILGITLYYTTNSLIDKTTDFALGKFIFGLLMIITTLASHKALLFVGPIFALSLFLWIYFRFIYPQHNK